LELFAFVVVGFLARVGPVVGALALLLVDVDFVSALSRLCSVVTVDAVALLVEMALLTASDWACGVDTVMSAGALAWYSCRLLYVSMLYARVVGMQVSSLSSSVCLGGVRRRINK
jgi:hypothetical protein